MWVSLIVFLIVLAIVALFVQKLPGESTIKSILNLVFIVMAIFAVLDTLGFTHFGILSLFPWH